MKKSNPTPDLDSSPAAEPAGVMSLLRNNGPLLLMIPVLAALYWIVERSRWIDTYDGRLIKLIGIYITLAVSLQLINGISGQFSLGHAGFMAVGAYASAYAALNYPHAFTTPAAMALLLTLSGLAAAAVGLLVGLPVLRLRGDYLAIATLGFGEIIVVVITNSPALGGSLGLNQIPIYTNVAWIYASAACCILAVWRLVHSSRGRAMLAIREDEIAAGSIGISPTRGRVLAFVVGAFFAGVAGSLYAHNDGYITPRSFNFMYSIELVVIVTLAGSGSISGTVLTAALLIFLRERLRAFSEWRMIIYSLLLISMMLLRPEGLLGRRELWPTRKRVPSTKQGAPNASP